MFKNFLKAVAASALMMFGASANAATVDILGGSTDLLISNLGVSATVSGDGSTRPSELGTIVNLAITGGSLDSNSGAAVIEHAGTSLTLTNGVSTMTLSNIVIDTGAHTVLADIAGGAVGALIFTIGDIWDNGRLPLMTADAFTSVFPETEDRKFALGNAMPEVPLPATGLLLLGGLGGLALYRRKAA